MERTVDVETLGTLPSPELAAVPVRVASLAPYFVVGVAFGVVLTKAEAVSWFRIQEMLRFGSFHMFGVLISAVLVASASIGMLRRAERRALNGEPIGLPPKSGLHRYWLGGSVFGIGWALTGACPGPLFTLVGSGLTVMLVAIASALVGTWVYGIVRLNLPH